MRLNGRSSHAEPRRTRDNRANCRERVGRARLAGVGSNSTCKSIEFAKDAEAAGADAIVAVVPYYNKPTQAGMYAHFRVIAESTGLPLILHDVPSRTVCGLADETIARLAEIAGLIGLKDAAGDLGRPLRLRALIGTQFKLFSGDALATRSACQLSCFFSRYFILL
jgi:4-hydroxy-tetrahydrodipicolinate synthase